MNKTLVAYFSASGTTAQAAENLAAAAGADIYEIKPAVPYTRADLNWLDKKSRNSLEMNDKSSRPELADTNADISAYDTIFVGFPIWWYTAPTIINTFWKAMISQEKQSYYSSLPEGAGLGKQRLTLRKLPGSCDKRRKAAERESVAG